MKSRVKLIRVATVAMSLDMLLKGQLKFLNQYYKVIALSGEDEHLKNVENREEVTTVSVKMSRQIKLLQDFKSLIALYITFKKEKPLIVHSITPKAGLLSMTASYFAGVPIRIHTFTGLIFPSKQGLLKKILIFMDQLTCKLATNIYPEGNGVKQDLIHYNVTKKPLEVIANGNVNGIDTSYFNSALFSAKHTHTLKNNLKINEGDFTFIFVGRLVGDKGINELIEAFNKLSNKDSKVKLLLVGSFEDELDPLKTKTKKIINENRQIISVGFQKDVRSYFAIADILAFPSYREGFPNVVLQAGAMGLPGIVSNINGCNEIIEEGKNGYIVPVKNVEALHKAMKKSMTDTGMKNNARAMITNRFEQQVVWDALLNEYKSLEKHV